MGYLQIVVCSLLVTVSLCDKERVSDGAGTKIRFHHHSDGEPDHADHQAILGSRKTADEFDELSEEESKRRLGVIAAKMDTDHNGFVDHDELTAWISKSMKSLDDEEAEERLKEMDENGDGKVSWDEYMKDSFPDQDISKLDSDDRKLLEEDRKYFSAADQDGDKLLNEDELRAFLNPENYPHMHKTLVEVTMQEKDENKDGAIDMKEYLGEMHEQPHSEWHAVERERFQNEYDENKDGLLQGDEVRRWLIPDLSLVASKEATHLMNVADKDKDGKLSIDEIVAEYRTFVGSEATNYGEELHKVDHSEL